jgi:hypothetical protein
MNDAANRLARRIASALLADYGCVTGMASDGRGGFELTPVADGPGLDWIVTVRSDLGVDISREAPVDVRYTVCRVRA